MVFLIQIVGLIQVCGEATTCTLYRGCTLKGDKMDQVRFAIVQRREKWHWEGIGCKTLALELMVIIS